MYTISIHFFTLNFAATQNNRTTQAHYVDFSSNGFPRRHKKLRKHLQYTNSWLGCQVTIPFSCRLKITTDGLCER